MTTAARDVQFLGCRGVRREEHLWSPREDGTYKCLLCGGVAKVPTRWDVADRYEPLTDAERTLALTGGA